MLQSKILKTKSSLFHEKKKINYLPSHTNEKNKKKHSPQKTQIETSLTPKTVHSQKQEQYQTKIKVNQLPNQSIQTSCLQANSSAFLQIQSTAHKPEQSRQSAFFKQKIKQQKSQLSLDSLSKLILNQYISAEAMKIPNHIQLQQITSRLQKKTEDFQLQLKEKDDKIKKLQRDNKLLKSKIQKLQISVSQNASIISQRLTEKQNQQNETNRLKQIIKKLQEQIQTFKQEQLQKSQIKIIKSQEQPMVIQLLKLILENKKIKSTLKSFDQEKWENKRVKISKKSSLQQSLKKIREISQTITQD